MRVAILTLVFMFATSLWHNDALAIPPAAATPRQDGAVARAPTSHARPVPALPYELDHATPFYRLELRLKNSVVELLALSYFESKIRPMPWLGEPGYLAVAKFGARVVAVAPKR